MNQLFYNQFGLEKLQSVFLCGDDSREMLTSILAREISNQNLKAIVFSNSPLKYPIEGQILVDIEPDLFTQELRKVSSPIIYLCSAIENEMLLPPSENLLTSVLRMDIPRVRFLIQLAGNTEHPFLNSELLANACMITSLNFNNLENKLGQFLTDFKSEKKFSDDLFEHWEKIISPICSPQFTIKKENKCQKILFINQVKSLIDENKIIGIFRNLTGLYDKIYLGNINDFRIKEI